MILLSQAQFPTGQVCNGHVETIFCETSVAFEELFKLTESQRYSSALFENGKRKKSNCNGFGNVLIYDVDNDTERKLSLSTAVELFEEIASLVVTTKSHQKEKNGIVADRYRILIPLDEAISIDIAEYSGYYLHVASALGIEEYIDYACKDVARMYQPNFTQEVYYSSSKVLLSEKQVRISFEEKKFLDNSCRKVLVEDSIPVYSVSKKVYLQSILKTQRLLDLLNYNEKFITGNLICQHYIGHF